MADTGTGAASGEQTQVSDSAVTVIVCVDGSEFSSYALKFYADEMHRPGNQVILAHAVDRRHHLSESEQTTEQSAMHSDENVSDAIVDRLGEQLASLKLMAKVQRIFGDPGHAIVKLAQEANASFIVIGSRGKGTIRRTLTGSVTDFVVHHSPVPVLVARHKEHQQTHPHHFHFNPFHKDKDHKEHKEHKGEKEHKGQKEQKAEQKEQKAEQKEQKAE